MMNYYKIPTDSLDLAKDFQERICVFGETPDSWEAPWIETIKCYPKRIRDRVQKFEDEHNSSKHWKKNRNASKPDKDAFWGKCGECIATIYLRQNGFPAVLPDFKVYSNIKYKKFEPDLLFSKKDVRFPDCGVKTCTHDTVRLTGQMSWTFQFSNTNGQGGRDRLFDNVEFNEPIVLVFVEPTLLKSRVVAVAPWCKLYPLLKDPVLSRYIGVKKCVYMDDLLEQENLKKRVPIG